VLAVNKVAAIITNYNMPERADALADYIRAHCPLADVVLVDNGSDIMPPPRNTAVFLPQNVQTTGGWLAGIAGLKKREYFGYWFLITSAEFTGGDPLTPMVEFLEADENAVGIHPALTLDSTTSWTHMIARGNNAPRRTWMLDNIACLYRAAWWDKHPFDPAMVYGWGIDLETCHSARAEGRGLWIDERSQVRKITDIGYTMNRMNMSADERRKLAGENMRTRLQEKYGTDYWNRMILEGVTSDMQ
jgi:hypothetical protein